MIASLLVTAFLACSDYVDHPTGPATPTLPASTEAKLQITPSQLDLAVGESGEIDAVVRDASGHALDGFELGWSTSDGEVADVDVSGRVQGRRGGSASIFVVATDSVSGAELEASASVQVFQVEVSPGSVTVTVGESSRLEASPSGGGSVQWRSLDRKVAGVDDSGLVTGEGIGSTKIVVRSGPAADTASVTVEETSVEPTGEEEPVSVTVSPSTVPLEVGETAQLEATSTGGTVSWRSLDAAVATVDGSGLVSGKGAGATKVLAEVDGAADTASVTVEETSVEPTSGGNGLVFEDDFEGGLAADQHGYGWSGGVNQSVEAGVGRNGSDALVVTHSAEPDGEDSAAQMDLHFGAELDEVWVEYWLYVPDNYRHRDSSGPDNNKFFQVWSGPRSGQDLAAVFELNPSWRNGGFVDDRSRLDLVVSNQVADDTPRWEELVDPLIGPADRGNWIRLRWHLKTASAVGMYDGLVEVWKSNTRVVEPPYVTPWPEETYEGLNLYARTKDLTRFDRLRLLGWSNSGYDEATTFRFDGFRIYDANPGW